MIYRLWALFILIFIRIPILLPLVILGTIGEQCDRLTNWISKRLPDINDVKAQPKNQ